jgi:hypothetical protein
MGLSGISKSQVSKLCKEIDERVKAFLEHPLEGDWPYLWLDATHLKVREGGRIVSVAAIIAVAANAEGRREIVGLGIGPSEAETTMIGRRRIDTCKSKASPSRPTRPPTSSSCELYQRLRCLTHGGIPESRQG